jgi:hypothetical protein
MDVRRAFLPRALEQDQRVFDVAGVDVSERELERRDVVTALVA